KLRPVLLTGNRHADGVLCHSDRGIAHQPVKAKPWDVQYIVGAKVYGHALHGRCFLRGACVLVEHPGTIKDPQRVRESWQSTFGGSGNANKVAVLEEGMKYTPISISPEQAQFLETRKFQINEIARIFRVPPHMV